MEAGIANHVWEISELPTRDTLILWGRRSNKTQLLHYRDFAVHSYYFASFTWQRLICPGYRYEVFLSISIGRKPKK
jgi:hypothetical protein